jgi:hypothetical protein
MSESEAKQLVLDNWPLADAKVDVDTVAQLMRSEAARLVERIKGAEVADEFGPARCILVRMIKTGQCALFETGVFAAAARRCRSCGQPGDKRCGVCRMSRYCSAACQRSDWKEHKLVCMPCTAVAAEHAVALLTDDFPAMVMHMQRCRRRACRRSTDRRLSSHGRMHMGAPKGNFYYSYHDKRGPQQRNFIIADARLHLSAAKLKPSLGATTRSAPVVLLSDTPMASTNTQAMLKSDAVATNTMAAEAAAPRLVITDPPQDMKGNPVGQTAVAAAVVVAVQKTINDLPTDEKVKTNQVTKSDKETVHLGWASDTLWSDVLAMSVAAGQLCQHKGNDRLLIDASITSFCIHYGHFYRLFCADMRQPV